MDLLVTGAPRSGTASAAEVFGVSHERVANFGTYVGAKPIPEGDDCSWYGLFMLDRLQPTKIIGVVRDRAATLDAWEYADIMGSPISAFPLRTISDNPAIVLDFIIDFVTAIADEVIACEDLPVRRNVRKPRGRSV